MEIFDKYCRDDPNQRFQFCSDLHLSLTKTLVFRHHWLESFVSSMRDEVTRLSRLVNSLILMKVYRLGPD
jgi:hypothetical protein